MKKSFTLLFFLLTFSLISEAQFTKIVGANGLDHNSTGTRNNGHAWGDVDNDGDLDVIMHVGAGGNATQGRLYINTGAANGFEFRDTTAFLIDGFTDNHNFGRQMLIVDFNNDGYNDILRGFGTSIDTEIYYNDGPPNYTFGNATQQPDVLIGAPLSGNHNTEGIAAIDWNQDGWLDIVVDNDDGGNDVYENDQAGGFDYVDPVDTGFPASHTGDGDYMTVADIDNDGYVDLYGRKTTQSNYWHFNPTTGKFETQAVPKITSNENDKGGTMFCDFDNDGDLDLFWTSEGTNQIWRNDGNNSWVATGIPAAPIATQTDIDGCDCGDVDNDGDLDIILGASSGNSYLLENTTSGGTLSFSTTNIATSANTESTTFTDYDNDGDLDLYFVVEGGENQLWENSTNDNNYLYVNALFDNTGSSRDAIGANVFLTNCAGDTTGLRQVNGGKGHGSQHQKKVHFGLDPDLEYIVEVHYVYDSTTLERVVVKKAIVPSNLPNQEISILNTDASEVFYCQDTDTDGSLDYKDLDDDNDGIPDSEENSGTGFDPHGDADNDGVLNIFDDNDVTSGFPAFVDVNNDGTNDVYDSDADGIADLLDLDGDNDGIPDIIEAKGVDTNGDGLIDYPTPSDPTSMVDLDNDGLADIYDETDTAGGTPGWNPGNDITNPDTDGDNIPDINDLDADNDGIPDVVETGGTDENGDGRADDFVDTDEDGFNDVVDGDVGNDGAENTANALLISGADTDSDGVPNSYPLGDNDNDGKLDHNDLDADNDGIPDVVEAGGTDENGDGRADNFADTDGDGFNDVVDGDPTNAKTTGDDTAATNTANALLATGADGNSDGTPDSYPNGDNDGDGKLDHFDLDADNDGIPDVVEAGGTDENGDGRADNFADTDGDGFNDVVDGDPTNAKTTGDDTAAANTANALLATGADGNSDGTPDTYPTGDSDSDGKLDHYDLDADNDGLPDVVEAGGIDTDGNGLADAFADVDNDGFNDTVDGDPNNSLTIGDDSADSNTANALQLTGADTNADGTPNSYPEGDTDGDNNLDQLDLDADNDGIPDVVEAGGIDTNGDGLVDASTDVDQDGLADIYDEDASDGPGGNGTNGTALVETDGTGKMVSGFNATDFIDTDGDNLPDHLDLDADNDGIPDIVEVGGANMGNGMVDTGSAPWDADNDGLADVYDENNFGTSLVKTTTDNNNDGKVNGLDSMLTGGMNIINYDKDAYPNHLDLDADNDGITDVVENASGAVNADNGGSGDLDGIVNAYDDSADTNGWNDASNANTTDTDSDGIPDYLDFDADNDGIVDYLEGVCSTCPTFVAPTGNDTNGNGVLDMYEGLTSANATGGSNIGSSPNIDDNAVNTIPDYLDTDTDNDGTNDWTEGYDANDNGQAADDLMTMATTYETNNPTHNYYVNATDSDSDGIPDWLDNQPSTSGYNEASRPPFLNPLSGFWHDEDNDGLVDLFDISEGGTNAPTPDNNGGNDLDWRDMTALVALPVKLSKFESRVEGCNVRLIWTAETEENFDHYELEWSGDGHSYKKVYGVKGKGGTTTATYNYLDRSASGVNYYRLKMIDLDGSVEYSNIVNAKTECEFGENEFVIYPNPVPKEFGMLNIRFFAEREEVKINIIDMTGRVARSLTLEVEPEWNTLGMDISDLPSGTYNMQIVGSRYSKIFNVLE